MKAPLSAPILQDVVPCPNDPNSFTNCNSFVTDHFHLDITVDFDKQSIMGSNTVNVTAIQDGGNTLILDYQGIVVQKVEECGDG